MLKFLPQSSDRDFCLITESTLVQNTKSKSERKEQGEEFNFLKEYGGGVIVFVDVLCWSKSKYKNHFFNGGRYNNLEIYHLWQYSCDLPQWNYSNKLKLFIPNLKVIEKIFWDNG